MHSLIQRDIQAQRAAKENVKGSGDGTSSRRSSDHERDPDTMTVPEIFTDPGYGLLGTSVLSTSNCGNPALRLFGFGPVTPEGYGIGQLPAPPLLVRENLIFQATLSKMKGSLSACRQNTSRHADSSRLFKHTSCRSGQCSLPSGRMRTRRLSTGWTIPGR